MQDLAEIGTPCSSVWHSEPHRGTYILAISYARSGGKNSWTILHSFFWAGIKEFCLCLLYSLQAGLYLYKARHGLVYSCWAACQFANSPSEFSRAAGEQHKSHQQGLAPEGYLRDLTRKGDFFSIFPSPQTITWWGLTSDRHLTGAKRFISSQHGY